MASDTNRAGAGGRRARCRSLEVVLDELEASRLALDGPTPGDVVARRAGQVDPIVDERQAWSRASAPAGAGA